MHKKFDSSEIEKKWQKIWEEEGIYNVGERDTCKEKEYLLVEWPYPSGNLHLGHWYAFAVPDIYVRFKRMNGKQVLFPMGFDAFGLPAENAAIKHKTNPKDWTNQNIAYMKDQLASMGASFSWDKTTSSTDPEYYKWTQWMFTQFFENGIAYRGKGKVNWCEGCHTVIANEQVLADGTCERCGTLIEKKEMPQWMLKITKYADRLTDDLDTLDWPEHIKEAQRQWIGRSKGALIQFPLNNLSTFSGKVLFASNNKGKLARTRKLIAEAKLNIILVTPEEVGITNAEVIEDESTLVANAEKKARHFSELTDLPVLADDTGFFIDGVELDPVTVKRNALTGIDEKTLTIEEVSEKMITYYANIATKHGGEVDAEWKNVLCLITAEKQILTSEAVRPVILTAEVHGNVDPYLPLRGLYKAKATGKYALTHNEEEEMAELKPITDAIIKVFTSQVAVFTTRPDTLYGATYLVLAPEHSIVTQNKNQIKNWSEIENYINATKQKDEQDRLDATKEKTGVKLEGITATNPASGEEIPVYIADYVLGGYGTGAIMAVPAHDERDFAFAKKFGLKIICVIEPGSVHGGGYVEFEEKFLNGEICLTEDGGCLINSGEFNCASVEEAKIAIVEKVDGRFTNTYRLRDWSIGRQRYWGVPIPIVYDPQGKAHVVPKEHLPWLLPEDVDFTPTGVPPLSKSEVLKKRTEEIFGVGWTPEVETMDTFVDSSWYFLRYLDNKNGEVLSSLDKQKDWMPVDTYFGGAEHTTMHLLYSRFWQKALFDLGLVTESEPYKRRVNRGLILGPDGNKMSKSKGNVIDPDEQVARVGADTVKMYLAFMGPYEGTNYPFDLGGIAGLRRFLERVNGLNKHIVSEEKQTTLRQLHKTIKKVCEDIVVFKFNTAISAMMVFVNLAEKENLSQESYLTFLRLLAPFAPHLTEELWKEQGNSKSIHLTNYPEVDEKLAVDDVVTIGVQINGKLRGDITIAPDATEEIAKQAVQDNFDLQKHLTVGEMVKFIYVPGRIVNVVVK